MATTTQEAAHGKHGHAHERAHPYHLVDPSPWPIVGTISALVLVVGGLMFMREVPAGRFVLPLGMLGVVTTMFLWWRDVIRESRSGDHSDRVARGLRIGMGLFILSEVFFFVAFFWAFFWAAVWPTEAIEFTWPPPGIETVEVWDIPFLNTLILLLSGATVTWAHHEIIEDRQNSAFKALVVTVALGFLFLSLQIYEYFHATFALWDGVYGSTFFMATGFHGFHVFIGATFLAVCMLRAYRMTFSARKHVGFEAAAWYWHFVDVVWLFLFVFVYWWSGSGAHG
jgi:cytochrome c oxidase subunit 3